MRAEAACVVFFLRFYLCPGLNDEAMDPAAMADMIENRIIHSGPSGSDSFVDAPCEVKLSCMPRTP